MEVHSASCQMKGSEESCGGTSVYGGVTQHFLNLLDRETCQL